MFQIFIKNSAYGINQNLRLPYKFEIRTILLPPLKNNHTVEDFYNKPMQIVFT